MRFLAARSDGTAGPRAERFLRGEKPEPHAVVAAGAGYLVLRRQDDATRGSGRPLRSKGALHAGIPRLGIHPIWVSVSA